ncbi:unnamed protein product [Mycena citricolor]|uniref:ATP-dependent DNA helicase n=1 Tax=Mycena citricolor TaxID=2018698 RepID=A0AAD2GT73_9AGAR|nr:unnamed protein product [Mycena citricolor]
MPAIRTAHDETSRADTHHQSRLSKWLTKTTVTSALEGQDNVELNEEQEGALRLVVEDRRNVFFTGSAGCGKSLLLRRMIKDLQKRHIDDGPYAVAVTASTGIAARHIAGVLPNLHITTALEELPSREDSEESAVAGKMDRCQVSMIHGDVLTLANGVGRKIRRSDAPFGGIQLVLSGDFYQLPPVCTNKKKLQFAFESQAWIDAIEIKIELKRVYRQSEDGEAFI